MSSESSESVDLVESIDSAIDNVCNEIEISTDDVEISSLAHSAAVLIEAKGKLMSIHPTGGRITGMAARKTLSALLCEIVTRGLTEVDNQEVVGSEGLSVVSNILSSILPGVCAAEVSDAFQAFAKEHPGIVNVGAHEADVLSLVSMIEKKNSEAEEKRFAAEISE